MGTTGSTRSRPASVSERRSPPGVRSVLVEGFWFMRTSLRNQIRRFTARIKSPRYAVAFLIGAVYFGFLVVYPLLTPDVPQHTAQGGPALRLVRTFGPVALALLAASWWLWRTDNNGISLTPAEASFLVPSPITRRQLIQFKLLRAQAGLLISALIVALMMSSSALPIPVRFLSAWVLFTILQLHRYGATLVHANLAENGRAGWRRVWFAALLFAAMLASVGYSLFVRYAIARAPVSLQSLSAALASAPAAYALMPFHAVLAPLNATDVSQWLQPFSIAAAIALAHYFWVISTDAAFEEGAAAAGLKRAAVVEAMRAGQGARASRLAKPVTNVRAPWFMLSARGNPAVAMLWKNVLAVTRGLSRRMLSVVVTAGLIVFVIASSRENTEGHPFMLTIGSMGIAYGALVTLMAPWNVRHDFRNDLLRLDLLRTLPVGGASLAAAEVATSTIVVSLMQFALVGIGTGCLVAAGKIEHPGMFAAAVVPAILFMIGVNATLVALNNWHALRFSAWVRKPGGIEMFGVAIIVMIASAIALAVALIVPVLVGFSAMSSIGLHGGTRTYIVGGAGVLVGLYGQLAFILTRVGRAYDGMDPVERTLTA